MDKAIRKRERFLVKYGNFLEFKLKDDISHFYADDKTVFLVDKSNKRYIVEFTLDQLEKILDERIFFRINRKFIINIDVIEKIKILSNRKLHLLLTTPSEIPVEVSRARVPQFRNWIDY